MTRATRRTLLASALVAAGSLAAIPTGWAANIIRVDNNSSTPARSFQRDSWRAQVPQIGLASARFEGGVGVVPTGNGQRGAWADVTDTEPGALRHNLTLAWQCTNGVLRSNGPIPLLGEWLEPDLAGTCDGDSTNIGAIITDYPVSPQF